MLADKKNNITPLVLGASIICFVTVLSQLPYFVESGTTQLAAYMCWIALAIYTIFMRPTINPRIIGIAMLIALITVILGFFSIATQKNYFDTRIFYAMMVSMGVFAISHMIPSRSLMTGDNDLDMIYYAYIFAATIVSISIYINYFQSGFSFNTGSYAYGSKNSASQIVITAVMLSFFCFKKKKLFINILVLSCLCINIVLLFLMRSRASIIGLVIVLLLVLLNKKINKYIRIATFAVALTFVLAVVLNEDVYEVIVNGILFAARDSSNLSDLSSGRYDEWQRFPSLFAEHPFIGRGRYKTESFPLSVLTQYGIFAGGMIIILALIPAIYAFLNRKKSKHHYLLLALCLVYLLNGIFEELSPFGPGVKCYFIWFIFGLLTRSGENERRENLSNTKAG